MYFPDELNPAELALVNATEKIAYLEDHLEEANRKEEAYNRDMFQFKARTCPI